MPLAIPYILGAFGLGAAGGVLASNGVNRIVQLAVIGGVGWYLLKGSK